MKEIQRDGDQREKSKLFAYFDTISRYPTINEEEGRERERAIQREKES